MRPINSRKIQPEHLHQHELQHSFSTNQVRFQPARLPISTQRKEITLHHNQLAQELKHYEWRQKTQFPIVRVISFQVQQSNQYQTILQINHEQCTIRLNKLKDLALFKLLFLLKESIIGFQRLFDRFGPFKVTSKMIILNPNNKCKVWLNQNFSSNSYAKIFVSQRQFLNEIFSLFEERSNKLKNTLLFFSELKKFTSFCQALSFIQNYARSNKINIPKICLVSVGQKISSQKEKAIRSFDPCLTMGRSPIFLNLNFRNTLKPEIDSPLIAIMQKCQKVANLEVKEDKNLKMKASGDTATGNSVKQTQCTKKNQSLLVDSIVFQEANKEIKTKSYLPVTNMQRPQIKVLFSRKLSKQGQKMKCHVPSYQKKVWEEECQQVGLDWNDATFLNDEQEENEVVHSALTTNVFNRNNWQKTINALFCHESIMKSSVHEGKQTRSLDISTHNLKLLEGYGKAIKQSCINGI